MYSQAATALSRPTLADTHANRVLTAAEAPVPSIHNAMHRLANVRDRMLTVQNELFKRLMPVSRVDGPMGSESCGTPPEPTTNCQLADDLNGVCADLERTCSGFEAQLQSLQV